MNEMNKKLGDKIISPLGKPYIIAEVGVNHEGSMNRAIDLIKSISVYETLKKAS